MKYLYNILLILSTVFFFSCQEKDELTGNSNEVGYLRLTVASDASTTTRADIPDGYNAKQIAVQIIDNDGSVIKKTDDWTEWEGEKIELPAGSYTIKASSANWDGMAAGLDAPYYTGSAEVKILGDQEVNASITCKLANVKVTVNYDEELLGKVKSIATVVRSEDRMYSINFTSTMEKSGYYPVTPLVAEVTVITDKGSNTLTQELGGEAGVQARDHFILNIHAQETGPSNINVTVDPTTHEYSYIFNVSTVPTSGATLKAGAWDRLAYLTAENITVGTGVSEEGYKLQYRTAASAASEGAWTDAETTASTTEEGKYVAFATGLTASTEYEFRLVNGENIEIQRGTNFTTGAADAQEQLPNAGFEDWYLLNANLGFMGGASSTWYPCSETYYNQNSGSYWDSSNPGTTQGMGSLSGGLNPTQGTTDVVHGGNQAAKLETDWAILKLAAASIYTGKFYDLVGAEGAMIDFGQSFKSRPISLKGWYQYSPVAIDHVGENQPAGTLGSGDNDQCSIYIVLSKGGQYRVNNTDVSTLLTAQNVWENEQFIAYGELPVEECVDTNGEWKNFNIKLKYKEGSFGEQPTHIIIVCSSSKYGDYFTGGDGSTLYLDDFSLDYDGTPTIWDLSNK